jgi:hypothetical protein
MNPSLNGSWSYRSFRHDPIVLKDGKVQGDPELAKPWSPRAVLEVSTSAEGVVSGTLTFAPGVALKVAGSITPATEAGLSSVSLTGEGLGSMNRIKGYFIPESGHVVGTIMCTDRDLLKQANGTLGPFVLVPIQP